MAETGAQDRKDDKAKVHSGLEFVLVEQPTRRASGDVRRRVRSHVTKLQHQRTREKETVSHTNAARPFISYSSQDVDRRKGSVKSGKVAKAKKASVSAVKKGAAAKTALAESRHENAVQIRRPQRQESEDDIEVVPARQQYQPDFDKFAKSDIGIAFSRGTMSFRTFALDDSTNTIGTSLEALGLDVASVLVRLPNFRNTLQMFN